MQKTENIAFHSFGKVLPEELSMAVLKVRSSIFFSVKNVGFNDFFASQLRKALMSCWRNGHWRRLLDFLSCVFSILILQCQFFHRFFPNSNNSFMVFSHSNSFGAELRFGTLSGFVSVIFFVWKDILLLRGEVPLIRYTAIHFLEYLPSQWEPHETSTKTCFFGLGQEEVRCRPSALATNHALCDNRDLVGKNSWWIMA